MSNNKNIQDLLIAQMTDEEKSRTLINYMENNAGWSMNKEELDMLYKLGYEHTSAYDNTANDNTAYNNTESKNSQKKQRSSKTSILLGIIFFLLSVVFWGIVGCGVFLIIYLLISNIREILEFFVLLIFLLAFVSVALTS